MVVYVTKILENGDYDDDFLEVNASPLTITIGKLRLLIEEELGCKYERDQYGIIKIEGENEEEINDDDDKTIAEILGDHVEDPTLYVAIRPLAGVRVEVTNKVSEEDFSLIIGETKKWQDLDLAWNDSTPIEVEKDRWWRRRDTKGNSNIRIRQKFARVVTWCWWTY